MKELLFGWRHLFKRYEVAGIMFLFSDSVQLAAQFADQLKALGVPSHRFGCYIQMRKPR